jgi:hypothetical protein
MQLDRCSTVLSDYRGNEGATKVPKEEGTDSLLVTWNGPDDPEVSQDHLSLGLCSVIDSFSKNPMNWSHGKKYGSCFKFAS